MECWSLIEVVERKPHAEMCGNFNPHWVRYHGKDWLVHGGIDYAYMHGTNPEGVQYYIEFPGDDGEVQRKELMTWQTIAELRVPQVWMPGGESCYVRTGDIIAYRERYTVVGSEVERTGTRHARILGRMITGGCGQVVAPDTLLVIAANHRFDFGMTRAVELADITAVASTNDFARFFFSAEWNKIGPVELLRLVDIGALNSRYIGEELPEWAKFRR